MADSRELTTNYAMNPNELDSFRPSAGSQQDVNSNREVEMEKVGQKVSDFAEDEHNHVAFPVQGIPPAAVPSDPLLRQAYSKPPAGLTMPHDQSLSRQYKMASDIFGTGMNNWNASQEPNAPQGVIKGGQQMAPRNAPNSFKITEMSPGPGNDGKEEQNGVTPAGRRARESSGNPLTGQGFDQGNIKTGKRYFEGSNANSKLW